MKTLKLLFIALAMTAVAVPAKAADVEGGLAVSIEAPDTFTHGHPMSISGVVVAFVHVLIAEAAVPIPNQDVVVVVDGAPVKTVTTDSNGTYSAELLFDATKETHQIHTVAFSGTLLEVRSRDVTVTIDRFLTELEVNPSSASIGTGETLQLSADALDNNGRPEDVTELALWTTSDPAVATVSNAAGSRGLVTGVSPGTVTITAAVDGLQATSRITVLSPA